ncbi:MAG: pyruvate carboxylase subunit B [Desulfohalobiaceae bacterium]|nr:pyruvate carboxylase subunit B [Desulfohalobiaceae bacterium]
MVDTHTQLQAAGLEEEMQVDNPLQIQDLTMRDGHQSLFATRGRTEDLVPIAEEMDKVGFFAMEVWGGATFDSMHRFLGEDPWERIRTLKKHATRTPFSMLLRGQNLVGYRNYPDDVARAFTERCCENGIDVFRVFDALNDFRNFQTVVQVIKEQDKHFQGAICYSLTEGRMGGEVYTLQYYLDKARELEDMGADTICIKDMAGIIAPYDAYRLVKSLKETVHAPIHLHSHFTSGMGDMAMLKAIEAGVDIIDVCLSPWAYRTSHPALEPLVGSLRGTSRDTGFDLRQLTKCAEHFKEITLKYRHLLDDRISIIDANVLLHQTPGGMISNLVNQLREMDALDKLDQVFEELPRVRRELGQVPLVTPTSQIVGIQTVNNVLFDTQDERYRMITAQVKDLCYGLYGQTPAPIDPELQKKALQDYPRGSEPYSGRPADILEPELEQAQEDTKGLAKDIDDVLIYALYPTTGKKFLRWKYGFEEMPEEVKPRTMEDVRKEQELMEKAKRGELVERPAKEPPPKGQNLRTFNVFVDDEYFRVEVENTDSRPLISSVTPAGQPQQPVTQQPGVAQPAEPQAREQTEPAGPEPQEESESSPGGVPVEAPMPGMVIRFEVEVGDSVEDGDVLLILEAMKMENSITAPASGTVKDIPFQEGDNVHKGDVLIVIG